MRPVARGFSLIETMVTVVLLCLGLLGVFSLQSRTARIELEAYQRSQALALAGEMASTIRASRAEAATYITDTISSETGEVYVGASASMNCTAPAGLAQASLCAWGEALAGERETADAMAMGAMTAARGCLVRPPAPEANALADLYVVVIWRGVDEAAPLPDDALINRCFNDTVAPAGTGIPPTWRRGVALRVLVPRLISALP